MKTFEITIGDDAYKSLQRAVHVAALCEADGMLVHAWALIFDKLDAGEPVSIMSKEDKEKQL